MTFLSKAWEMIKHPTEWWIALLIMGGFHILIIVLFFIRHESRNDSRRSFLDFILGLLNGAAAWEAIAALSLLNWIKPIKAGIRWFLRVFGDESLIGYYFMTLVATVIFVIAWLSIFLPIFLRAGSNFAVKVFVTVFMVIFGMYIIADSLMFAKGLMGIISFFVCGFIVFMGLLIVLKQINTDRCPECHSMMNTAHNSRNEVGQATETTNWLKIDTNIDESNLTHTETKTRGIKTTKYNVFTTDHKCMSCGYEWDTEKRTIASQTSTPTQRTTTTTTYK